MPYVPDPGVAIADAVVEYLNDPARGFWLYARAEQPTDPMEELKREGAPLRVLVYPVAGVTTKNGRGGEVTADREVRVIVTGPMGPGESLAGYLGFAYEIERALWGQPMAGATWIAAEVTTYWDPTQLDQMQRFLAARSYTYRLTDKPPA